MRWPRAEEDFFAGAPSTALQSRKLQYYDQSNSKAFYCRLLVTNLSAKTFQRNQVILGARMRVSRSTSLLCALAVGTIAVCGARPALAISEAQRAYNACVDSYNSKYRSLGNHKAIVAGLTDSSSQCFWSYNSASEQDAINSAMNACRRVKPRCFLYASTSKHSDWSQRIANMGGNDGTNRSSGGGGSGLSLGTVLDVAGAVVGGVAAARGGGGYSGGGGGRIPSTSGYSQKGAFDDCAAVYSAAGNAAAAAQCRQRSSNMGSIR
jgi:hypothetical protein